MPPLRTPGRVAPQVAVPASMPKSPVRVPPRRFHSSEARRTLDRQGGGARAATWWWPTRPSAPRPSPTGSATSPATVRLVHPRRSRDPPRDHVWTEGEARATAKASLDAAMARFAGLDAELEARSATNRCSRSGRDPRPRTVRRDRDLHVSQGPVEVAQGGPAAPLRGRLRDPGHTRGRRAGTRGFGPAQALEASAESC